MSNMESGYHYAQRSYNQSPTQYTVNVLWNEVEHPDNLGDERTQAEKEFDEGMIKFLTDCNLKAKPVRPDGSYG